MMKKVKKIKIVFPKDEIFQILKHQSPLSINQCVSFKMLKKFYL